LLRKVKSISAGEYQRLLLIKYLSFKGTDSLFILDEPSLGLRHEEIYKLINGLRKILDQGNSVILIDHSELVQKLSDELIVMGPGSGKEGGEVLYHGTPKDFFKERKTLDIKWKLKEANDLKFIEVKEASIFGKKFSDIKIPLNQLTWIDGPSGVGKTSLFVKVIANEIAKKVLGEEIDETPYEIKGLKNYQKIEDVIIVSSDLNRFTSRSTIGSMTELSSVIRKHFLKLPMVKSMNLKEGHLSSNSELGMCPKCEGKGSITIEMQYLEDIVLECEECRGLKIKPIYANLSDGKMTLSEAYSKPISEVLERIDLTPKFRRVWEYLKLLNLDYLSLERPLNSLSGGERQRIYLLNKLLKNITNSLIIFENLSFGLSEKELVQIGVFLNDLTEFDNTILVIDTSPTFEKLVQFKLDGENGFHWKEGPA
jgi:excinuclease ABC subunit A